MVLRDGLALIAFGLVAGVPLLLAGSALIAGLLPALRAARVGPLVALQTE